MSGSGSGASSMLTACGFAGAAALAAAVAKTALQ